MTSSVSRALIRLGLCCCFLWSVADAGCADFLQMRADFLSFAIALPQPALKYDGHNKGEVGHDHGDAKRNTWYDKAGTGKCTTSTGDFANSVQLPTNYDKAVGERGRGSTVLKMWGWDWSTCVIMNLGNVAYL